MSVNPVAELQKLAHQVGVDVAQLDFLAALPGEDLRTLRAQIGEALFQADKHHFVKVAALSKSVPAAVAARVTEFALPPLIAARTAELLEPAKAVDMVGRLSGGYLARVAAAMDPARAAHLIEAIPADKIAMVGRELAATGEWVIIAGFVSHVTAAGLGASVAVFTGEQLLRIGFVLDDTARLGEIATMLTDKQIEQMLAAARQFELWRELDELVSNIDGAEMARMAGLLSTANPDERAAVAAAAAAGLLSTANAAKLGVGSDGAAK
jgi:hypothetical protein